MLILLNSPGMSLVSHPGDQWQVASSRAESREQVLDGRCQSWTLLRNRRRVSSRASRSACSTSS